MVDLLHTVILCLVSIPTGLNIVEGILNLTQVSVNGKNMVEKLIVS